MTELPIPERLRSGGALLDAPGWLDALPRVVAELSEEWELALEPPYEPGGITAYVAPATRADGTQAVLKVAVPTRETEKEGAALELLRGDGAVALLASDVARSALLLERCVPGTPLAALDDVDEADGVAASVLARLWRRADRAHPFEHVGDRAAEWARSVIPSFDATGAPFERVLAERAASLFADLAEERAETFLLHGDFHHENVLAAKREPWLAIDPKPLVGDRAFDVSALLWNRATGVFTAPRPAHAMDRRLRRLSELLGVDEDRVRAWGSALAVEYGLWCYEVGDSAFGAFQIACARLIAAKPR